jgi:hypothetical protein
MCGNGKLILEQKWDWAWMGILEFETYCPFSPIYKIRETSQQRSIVFECAIGITLKKTPNLEQTGLGLLHFALLVRSHWA